MTKSETGRSPSSLRSLRLCDFAHDRPEIAQRRKETKSAKKNKTRIDVQHSDLGFDSSFGYRVSDFSATASGGT